MSPYFHLKLSWAPRKSVFYCMPLDLYGGGGEDGREGGLTGLFGAHVKSGDNIHVVLFYFLLLPSIFFGAPWHMYLYVCTLQYMKTEPKYCKPVNAGWKPNKRVVKQAHAGREPIARCWQPLTAGWQPIARCCTTTTLSRTLGRECVRTLWMGAPFWGEGGRILVVGTGSVSWLRTKEEGRRDP